jgi:hypothetical protein
MNAMSGELEFGTIISSAFQRMFPRQQGIMLLREKAGCEFGE